MEGNVPGHPLGIDGYRGFGPIKLVKGGGWCDNCNAASADSQESNDACSGK
jgi:hypothetical protein